MNLDSIVILNPDYHFKNDIDRIVMYSKKDVALYSSSNWIGYIHPVQALILSLFITPCPLKEQLELLSAKFNMNFEKINSIIDPYIDNEQSFCTEFASNKIYFPKNVLISIGRISFESVKYNIDTKDFQCDGIDLTQDRMHKSPQSLLMMLTSKCVTECKYCYADKKTKYEELDTDRILQIIEESRLLRMTNIDVIGGEVFCRKDWNIILQALVKSDLAPYFISTKVPITSTIAQLLYQTGYNNVIQISLDSLNEEYLSKIIGIRVGYLEKVKKGIDYLQQYGFKIQINSILTKYNSSHEEMLKLYEYVNVIQNLVYWEIRVPGASIYTPLTFSEIKADKATLQEICDYVRENIIPTSNINIRISNDELENTFQEGKCSDLCFRGGRCGVLENKLFILPDGKVSLCEQLYWHPQFVIGDLREQTLEEVWRSKKASSMFLWKRDFYQGSQSICTKCKVFDFCHNNHRKCWYKIIRAYGVKKWDYPDPRCEFAPEIEKDTIYR